MKLSSLLNPKLVKCGLAAGTKEEALDEIIGLMAEGTPGLTPAELRAALAEREKLGPFSMAKGSAFPHARTEKVTDFRVAIGTAPAGIDFKAPDGNPIRIVVLFAIPKKHSNLYLHTLAQFLNLFGAEENLQRVVHARTGDELIAAIDGFSPRPPVPAPAQGTPTVTGATPLSKAVELLVANRLEALPVVDGEGNLIGELTARALLQFALREHFRPLSDTTALRPAEPFEAALRVHAASSIDGLGVISPNGFRTVHEEEPLAEMALKLSQGGAAAAYVLRGRKPVGTMTLGDVLRRLSGAK